jgi:hypothetical protein
MGGMAAQIPNRRDPEAIDLFRQMSTAPALSAFLTLPAYRLIV